MEDLGEKQNDAMVLFYDNQSAIAFANNPMFHGHLKHIEIWHHFIQEQVARGKIDLVFCKTKDQIVDIFMKALPKIKFTKLRKLLHLCSLNQGDKILEI